MVRLFSLAAVLTLLSGPAFAGHHHGRHHHHWHGHHWRFHHWHHHRDVYGGMNYLHNYAPGPVPGTVVTMDGPVTALCAYGAAAYLGQDRRRHPCN